MSFNDLNQELKKSGYNHSYRRNLLRDIPKEARDIEVAPELPKGLKLAKGFGIASTALAGVTAIDTVGTVGGYLAGDALAGVAVSGTTAAAAVVLAPEIAVGVGVAAGVVAGVAVVGAVSYIASEGASTVKGWFGLH